MTIGDWINVVLCNRFNLVVKAKALSGLLWNLKPSATILFKKYFSTP